MKALKPNKKLALQRETVSNLVNADMSELYGGSLPPTYDLACRTYKLTNCPECPPQVSVIFC